MEPSLGLGSCHGHRNCFRCAVLISCSEVGFPGRRAKRTGDYGRSVVLLALSVVGLVEACRLDLVGFLLRWHYALRREENRTKNVRAGAIITLE